MYCAPCLALLRCAAIKLCIAYSIIALLGHGFSVWLALLSADPLTSSRVHQPTMLHVCAGHLAFLRRWWWPRFLGELEEFVLLLPEPYLTQDHSIGLKPCLAKNIFENAGVYGWVFFAGFFFLLIVFCLRPTLRKLQPPNSVISLIDVKVRIVCRMWWLAMPSGGAQQSPQPVTEEVTKTVAQICAHMCGPISKRGSREGPKGSLSSYRIINMRLSFRRTFGRTLEQMLKHIWAHIRPHLARIRYKFVCKTHYHRIPADNMHTNALHTCQTWPRKVCVLVHPKSSRKQKQQKKTRKKQRRGNTHTLAKSRPARQACMTYLVDAWYNFEGAAVLALIFSEVLLPALHSPMIIPCIRNKHIVSWPLKLCAPFWSTMFFCIVVRHCFFAHLSSVSGAEMQTCQRAHPWILACNSTNQSSENHRQIP